MRMIIHRFIIAVAAALVLACTERESTRQPNDLRADADASSEQDASTGSKDESAAEGELPRPGLPRPPKSGLPAQLHPPR